MAVETKKMAKLDVSGGNFGDRSSPGRTASRFLQRRAQRNAQGHFAVVEEVQATTTVVVITVFIFAAYFAVIDYFIQNGVTYLFNYFKAHDRDRIQDSDSRFATRKLVGLSNTGQEEAS